MSDDALLEEICNASSTNDCTGLIPTAPESKAELESYNEVYHYLPSPPKHPHRHN
ncbi:MAG: hypothetical protein PUC32_03110 [Oscillospiraceae bacterium]|nr:hypothetical protein [Oscillospiraceae bacterium]